MRLSIIINHYKSRELLRLCLKSIQENVGGEFEVIVRDSEAEEETREMMREEFPGVRYLPEQENVGFARSVNRGMEEARGDYLLNLNADIVVPSRGRVEKLVEYMAAHKDVGMLGPKLLSINDETQRSAFRFYKPLTLLYRRTLLGSLPWGRRDLDRFLMRDVDIEKSAPMPVDWIMGSAMLTTRTALDRVGGLDDRFFMYMEDVDWCRRFWEAGYQVVYHPGFSLIHYHKQASRGRRGLFDIFTNRYTRIHVLSAVKFFWKHGLRAPHYGV